MTTPKWVPYVAIPAAIVASTTAWNTLVLPLINSDFSPVAGTIRVKAVESIQQETVKSLEQTNKSLDKTNLTVDGIVKRIDRTACTDWNRRLRTADDALSKNRNDLAAEELRRNALDQIFSLGDCPIEPVP